VKVGDIVQLSPEYNRGKWANALVLILAYKPEQIVDSVPVHSGAEASCVEFYEVMCKDEIWDAPSWSLMELKNESR